MKKMPTLFKREFTNGHVVKVLPEVTPGCEWVLNGEGVATRKLDGTCTMVQHGKLYKRYDAKRGKTPPPDAIPCQPEPDPVTGHWPHWVPVKEDDPGDKWFVEAWKRQTAICGTLPDGTYELCGPHFQGNPEDYKFDLYLKHGGIVLSGVPRDFEGIREYMAAYRVEGIVFHHPDGRMCKIKRSDFGLPWPCKQEERQVINND